MAEKKQSTIFTMWPEPIFADVVKTNRNFKANFNAALLYAHYELSAAELKKGVVKYLKHLDPKHSLLSRVAGIHENKFATIGKYIYILNHGCDLPDDIRSGLNPALEKVIESEEARLAIIGKESAYISDKESLPQIRPAESIQDRMREKAREVSNEIEGWLDEFCMNKKLPAKSVNDFTVLFKSCDLKSPHMRYIRDIFSRRGAEVAEALDGKDKDLLEAYSNFTKAELKKYGLFYSNLSSACGMIQEGAKITRTPRKKKPVSQEKVVSKIKFKKDDSTLGIVSLNPVHIIGSKEVWCFDTKTRKLIKYVADDVVGPISIKGASLIGYNEAKSSSKTLRKPVVQLAEFKKCGKVQLRSFMDNIGTVGIIPNGRMNEHCVILKVA